MTSAGGGDGDGKGKGLNAGEEVKVVVRKKSKRVRKRKKKTSEDGLPAQHGEEKGEAVAVKESGVWEYPFTSPCSVMQRKMKLQYDHFVRSNDNKALTLAQVIKKLLICYCSLILFIYLFFLVFTS